MNGTQNQYNVGLDKNAANYVPLTPVSFLARSGTVYPNHASVVYEDRRFTWGETYARCRRFASYLSSKGINVGDTVAAMLPNVPAMYELHFAVPMAGGVLNALNIRLDAASIAFQLDHGGAKIILVDPEFSTVIDEALKLMSGSKPFVIDVDDATYTGFHGDHGAAQFDQVPSALPATSGEPLPLTSVGNATSGRRLSWQSALSKHEAAREGGWGWRPQSQ